MDLVQEVIIAMNNKKDIVEELIKIDNEVMGTSLSFNDYLNSFKNVKKSVNKWSFNNNVLFVTEGNPLYTLEILRRLDEKNKYVIFINQGFLGMNKWLVNEYTLLGLNNVELDTNLNYNDYINMNYKVISIGEDELNKQVMEDFYES